MHRTLYHSLRPLLFRLDPERAHSLSLGLLRLTGWLPPLRWAARRAFPVELPRSPVRVFGLSFPNRVGLAAGYDKDGIAWRGLACLGFGHLELGTVTPQPQPGNPRPRVFRLADERSLINSLGFPSRGADFVLRRLRAARSPGVIVGLNLGKQKETPLDRAAEDYELLMDKLAPAADYLTVNISSPNTRDLRELQRGEWLGPLLRRLTVRRNALRERFGRALPLLVKLSPDLSDDELDSALRSIREAGVDGVVATNTTTSREGVASPLRGRPGGLSGAALGARSTGTVRRIAQRTGGELPIVASGGVMGPADAREKLDAGASLVQIYTGLIYEGPDLVRRIVRESG